MPYKFEREELLQLLIRAYNEGNYGFLDLSESVAEKIIEENECMLVQTQREEFNGVSERILSSWPNDNMPTINDTSSTIFPYTFSYTNPLSFTVNTGESFTVSGAQPRNPHEPHSDGGIITHEQSNLFTTRNFSDESILIDRVQIELNPSPDSNDIIDNLVVHNSNQVEADGSFVQKQLD